MNELDRIFDVLSRNSVGFERLANRLANPGQMTTYPPYNIIREDGYNFVVEVAAAGFKPNEVLVEQQGGLLKIRGMDQKDEDKPDFIHKGIATRTFNIVIELAEYLFVTEATFVDGLLRVRLERQLPDHLKPRVIPVTTAGALEDKSTEVGYEPEPNETEHALN